MELSTFIAEVAYLFSALASLACALLLIRAYLRKDTRVLLTRSFAAAQLLVDSYKQNANRLLLWSGICFVAFMVQNILLLVDVAWARVGSLLLIRHSVGMVGALVLLIGLVVARPMDTTAST